MGTSLYLITNTKLTGEETKKDWNLILEKLKELNLEYTSLIKADGTILKESGDWNYKVNNYKDEPFSVEFLGPFNIEPILYQDIGIIDTIHRYSVLYKLSDLDWFHTFRKNLFDIVKVIGGTEVIYVADNSCDKLANYLYNMAWENVPYEVIKNKMIQDLGTPVTDYSKLNYDKLDYRNITEFFLDDFSDIN
ncbi:hypothetical protein [Wenyingzhuangia marina]|uniref:Uncharacterized protein n=1 Tax=Wenyingzhuangia marina TaxID=1195760 RepID=A0A1M5VCU0_9FLAO|nr:hypothetical protein [Wenyingzhuangia marina]GGF72946.1 hypothetical protein GCM10011397_14840 [Wenyingzhuangia marina]SHH73037.1 hypothetical protein SAMN05444281_1702 [Wenyingzhuangia marina]